MKNLLILTLLLSSFTLKAATYFCEEQTDPNDMRKERVSIEIKEVQEITPDQVPRDYDYSYQTKVTLTTKVKGEIASVKKFTAVSNVADVYYSLISKENGIVDFYIYLDELNEAGIEYLNEREYKVSVRLNCIMTEE